MPRKQKGVNPLIATILLLLVVMAIGGIIWSWLSGYTQTTITEADKKQKEITGCAGASFVIDLSDVEPIWYGGDDHNQVKMVLLNKGDRDLNNFDIYSYFSDGSSDRNEDVNLNLPIGGSKVAWTKGSTSASKPVRVSVESADCKALKASLTATQIKNG